jgi:hypothetical protein
VISVNAAEGEGCNTQSSSGATTNSARDEKTGRCAPATWTARPPSSAEIVVAASTIIGIQTRDIPVEKASIRPLRAWRRCSPLSKCYRRLMRHL